jgi:putative transposase
MFTDFSYGTRFRIGETEYEVLRQRGEDLEVLNISYDVKELLTLQNLLSAYNEKRNDKRLFFKQEKDEKVDIEYDLSDYSKDEIEVMNQRYLVIEPFIEGRLRPSGVKSYIENYPEEMRPNGSLSPASFYRWIKLWYKRRYKLDLIPRKTGPKDHRVSKEVMTEVSTIILKYSKKAEYITIRDQFYVLDRILKDTNVTRDDKNKMSLISESTFRRLQKKKDDSYERDKEIMGLSQADLKHNGVHSTTKASRPLEVMELDWTPVDCLIVDFELDETFRPVLMYGIDQATDEPMGFNIVFKAQPNAGDWKQLILHCILPKTNIKENYPRVQKEWTAYGIPQSILLDNASVNDAIEVAEVCAALHIGLRYAEVEAGHQKGTIEQALGNLNHKAFQGLVGSLFSNTDEKGKYDAKNKATVDIKGLYHITYIAIVDLVANNYNRGENVKGVPEHEWQTGLREMKVHPRLPYKREYLELIFSTDSVTRVIVPRGIELMGHFFFSEELNELRKRLEREGKSRSVCVRYGSDMRVIYVRDEFNKRYIEAFIKNGGLEKKKIDREYPIHAELLAYLTNKNGKEYNEFDTTHLGRARIAIEEIQEECKLEFKGVKRRKRRELAEQETVVSAMKGVPSHLIPGIAETISINVLKVQDGIKTSKSVKDNKSDIILDPKPGELYVDNVDLESFANSWGTGRKEIM